MNPGNLYFLKIFYDIILWTEELNEKNEVEITNYFDIIENNTLVIFLKKRKCNKSIDYKIIYKNQIGWISDYGNTTKEFIFENINNEK